MKEISNDGKFYPLDIVNGRLVSLEACDLQERASRRTMIANHEYRTQATRNWSGSEQRSF